MRALTHRSCGFSLVEVIVTLVLASFVALMAATVMGAGYLRSQQIMTQQTDIRRLGSCMEHIRAVYGERRLPQDFQQGLNNIEQCQGIQMVVEPVRMNMKETEQGKEVTVEKSPQGGSLYQIRLMQDQVGFTYVVGP